MNLIHEFYIAEFLKNDLYNVWKITLRAASHLKWEEHLSNLYFIDNRVSSYLIYIYNYPSILFDITILA